MNTPEPVKPAIDEKRKAMMAAAQAYDEVQREMTSLRDQLHTAVAGLEAKNSEITEIKNILRHEREQFDVLLREERANVDVACKARDQAYAERADALAWLSAIEAVIDRAHEGGLQPPRRKRNGRNADDGVAVDSSGTAGGVPNPAGGGA